MYCLGAFVGPLFNVCGTCAGTLFSKVNLSDCEQILPAAIFDVQDFLSRDGALQAFTHKANSPQGANNVLLQLAVLSMFSLFDVSGSSAKLG